MTGPEPLLVVEVDVNSVDLSMEAVADRVVAVLEEGTIRVVDFAGLPGEQSIIRAVGYPGGDDAA